MNGGTFIIALVFIRAAALLPHRRLLPLLSGAVSTWAVDLVGWGFTDSSAFAAEEALALRPEDKRAHLYAFWKQHIGRPMALVGASLGGAVAIDFATAHPEACLVVL